MAHRSTITLQLSQLSQIDETRQSTSATMMRILFLVVATSLFFDGFATGEEANDRIEVIISAINQVLLNNRLH